MDPATNERGGAGVTATEETLASNSGEFPSSPTQTGNIAQAPSNYWAEVGKQVVALTKKNFILAKRNWISTSLRVLSSLFFVLLIFGVNEGIKTRLREEAYNKDIPSPEAQLVEGIPACVPKYGKTGCYTLAYAPAPSDEFKPESDYTTVAAFAEVASTACSATGGQCSDADCDSIPQRIDCSACCEAFRTHKIVRGIMNNNGTSEKAPIAADKVLGFVDARAMDKYLLDNPETVQGAYIFESPNSRTATFTLQQNSTTTRVRGVWQRPFFTITLPMQVMAQKEIVQQLHLGAEDSVDMTVLWSEFAHPAFDVSSFEGIIAPLFLLACAMFPFAIQMAEVVVEKELKLRQALSSMGLYDLAYWLSWHLYQMAMSFTSAFFIFCFGAIFQLQIFTKNDFGVILLTFWFFSQAMVGFAFFCGAFLRRSSSAVMVGFSVFLLGFLFYFMVGVFGFPYGTYKVTQSFSYDRDIISGNYTWKDNSDPMWEPLFAFIPPTLLIKAVADMGVLSASDKDSGLRFRDRYSYCQKDVLCNPSYSVGVIWSWFIGLYFLYSLLGLYLENVLPDAMGVRKQPWYFLTPTYWGFGTANVEDKVETIEESTDPDVVEEESQLRARCNQPIASDSALEIRGLRQTFTGRGKPFHAVKAPWYSVKRKQLFALLGPNGAGKTTTINMLTGVLPPTAGNALVYGQTVAHPSGMQAVKKTMGVCPQFDILWERLTAREHLQLFGSIKGISPESLPEEVIKRLEEVKLESFADQVAGTFSGGMKRRLSVSVALIGAPQIVYLDEPTTGMDPISRRHVWDVIEAAKQDRTVILTTHSMEEADILGDRIAIMAKGRLRCLGNSVRLKTRFGAGYKVSVSCGDKWTADVALTDPVREMFARMFSIEPAEVTSSYMHFEVPKTTDAAMTDLFMELEARREELQIADVQLSMSTLEDVFLTIAAQAEKEAAASKPIEVELKGGEKVQVPLGTEEEMTHNGVVFKVKWGTDEDGNLMAVDTIETRSEQKTMLVTVPQGVEPGQTVQVDYGNQKFAVEVPPGLTAGETFNATITVKEQTGARGPVSATTEEVRVRMTAEEVRQRVENLQTPFSKQAGALFWKNLTVQRKKYCTNCCLLLVPLFFIVIVLMLQLLIEILFLGQKEVRCPYCGPADDYAETYCQGKNCTEFFFPDGDRDDLIAKFGEDPIPLCNELARTCPGDGDDSCFLPNFARDSQFAFCPLPFGISQPPTYYNTPPEWRSATPVIYTAEEEFGRKVAGAMFDDGDTKKKLQGAAAAVTDALFNAMFGVTAQASCHGTIVNEQQQQGLCMLLQHGLEEPRPCCRDVSEAPLLDEDRFVSGRHYWSPTPGDHNEGKYNATLLACLSQNTMQQCNQQIKQNWTAQGVRFASGSGKAGMLQVLLRLDPQTLASLATAASGLSQGEVEAQMQGLLQVTQLGGGDLDGAELLATLPLLASLFAAPMEGEDEFWCVEPLYSAEAKAALPDTCINLEEGLARLAFADDFDGAAHYPIQPDTDVDKITVDGEELFADTGGRWAQTCDWFANAEPATAPCLCKWLILARGLAASVAFPSGFGQAGDMMQLPTKFNCPKKADTGEYQCSLGEDVVHPMSIPELGWSSHVRSTWSFFSEPALSRDEEAWWNWRHVLTAKDKQAFEAEYGDWYADKDLQNECERERTCWIDQHFEENGRLLMMARDCAAMSGEVCYVERMLNLSGIFFECDSAAPEMLASREAMDVRLYQGQWDRFDDNEDFQEEFISAFDLHDTSETKLRVTVMFNDTTELLGGGGGPRIVPRGIFSAIDDAFEAFVNAKLDSAPGDRRVLAAMGLKEMPKPANFLSLDLGSLIGPFFFTMAFSMLFPTMVVALVYEKEVRLRVMMRMMGLGTTAYWLINYLFWLVIYALFVLLFVGVGSGVSLPSGYTIGLFTKNEASVHFVLFFLFINNTISLAFLWATLIRSARVAQVSSILFVLTMAMIAWAAWDSGNFYNSETVSTHTKNFITIFPLWNFYRGWNEYREYAFQAVYLGVPGLSWNQISNDPNCGMDAVLVALFLEWPFFLLLALYLDQVLDSGNGVPQHPLFFIGKTFETHANPADLELASGDGAAADLKDVKDEAERVRGMANQAEGQRDAVVIQGLNKVYPARLGTQQKVAVKTLTMGVQHGECFGMLGPNGAGKTTTINMLTGFAQPTAGTALVESFDIRTEMAKIYTLMGVCPQHDILWDTLTARQHMLFYGRLKNLAGETLSQAVAEGLKQVNLHKVMDQKAMTFSGGMKRRLSVAISMIGAPLVCYLDEPSTGLDPASRRTLWGVIKEAKRSRAIFLTTHSMEEAEGLCDRLGIFVDGQLRCVGSPKTLTQKFGGFYVLTIHSDSSKERQVCDMVHAMARDVRITYGLAGTQKFEIPADQITLSQVFRTMTQHEHGLGIKDWGIANTTLEEAFVKISKGAVGT